MAEETLELYAQIIEEISAYKRTVAAFQESSLPFHGCRTALQLSDWCALASYLNSRDTLACDE